MNDKPHYKSLLVDNTALQLKIDELADKVIERYQGKNPLFVCLLRGGAPFASLLMFAIAAKNPNFHPEMDYMTIRAYGDKRVDNPVELIMDLSPSSNPHHRHIVLLDDVLDKGVTAEFARDHLLNKGATAVDLVVLIQKQKERSHYGDATIYGFDSPPDWLTGMGLDDVRIAPEANRWAQFIALANEAED